MKSDYFKNWKGLLLWSNHFYGLCAALLSIETTLVILNTFPSLDIICLIYFGTILYYTHAYLNETKQGVYNERSNWYHKYQKYLYTRQLLLTILLSFIFFFRFDCINLYLNMEATIVGILIFSVAIAILYYFPIHSKAMIAIRAGGLLKSISIAWVWSVTCCLVPIILTIGATNHIILLTPHFALYFFQQFIFILILAILFDIKDMARDKAEVVNTIVLKYGIQSTIRKLITPLAIVYLLLSFAINYLYYPTILFSFIQLLLIVILYFLTTIIQKTTSIHKSIFLIDGLIIVKALFGILYITYS